MLRDQIPKDEPLSGLLHVVDDAYEDFDWNSFNDLTLSDSDSGNESAFEAAAEECLRGIPVFGPPEAILNGDGSGRHRKGKVAYVVFNGREMGVFETWSATSFQVHGFESSRYQGYDSVAKAEAAWEHACACGVIGNPSSPMKKTATSSASAQKTSVTHPPTKAPTTLLPSNLPPSNLAPIQPQAIISPPLWPHHYSNLPSTCLSETLLNLSSTAVHELLPQRSAFTPVPCMLLPPAPVPPPSHSFQAMPTSPLGDEQAWWVVIAGEFPGAYLGRKAAKKAAGRLGPVTVKKVGSRDQVFCLFGMAMMDASATQYHVPAV